MFSTSVFATVKSLHYTSHVVHVDLRIQKSPEQMFRASVFDAWQFPTLAWGDPTLPSALRRFTSEFGMGSGGTTALKPPGKFF